MQAHSTQTPVEQGFLVGAQLKGTRTAWTLTDSLDELEQLAATAGIEVVGRTYQYLDSIHAATYIGSGKVEEIASLKEGLGYDVIIFDDELSPGQLRNLESALGVKILDRTSLILDVFAQHAHTHEGRLQVELAQYQYRLPRLTRAWTHLARQAGGSAGRGGIGGVGLRGPGETQLEVDRREILQRIAYLQRKLEQVRVQREQYRRRRDWARLPVVALVGYTNAGKSTLLNALTGSDVLVADKLFATLDPTTRRVDMKGGQEVLFTDTVGFIQKLPPSLIAAFRATLEEVAEADVLLHVVDVSHKNALEQAQTVGNILKDLGATEQPVVTALNKIDRLEDVTAAQEIAQDFTNAVAISATEGIGLEDLLGAVADALSASWLRVEACIPYNEGELVALFHDRGIVEAESHEREGTRIVGRAPRWLAGALRPYLS